MSPEDPLISVVTAVHNGAPFLLSLIESVQNQDYPHVEHIVIDDGSDDDGATRSILQSYPHVRWWSRSNRGQYATQNEALAAAQGSIVSVISADDVYLAPGTFSAVVRHWQAAPGCDLLYGRTLHMDITGKLLPYQLDLTGPYPGWLLKYYLFIQHCSLFIARDFILKNGIWFDPSFRYAGDWDWIVRLFKAGPRAKFVGFPLSAIRLHPAQASRQAMLERVADEHRRVCRSYGANYGVHVLLRKLVQYRAMTAMALFALRSGGPSNLWRLAADWRERHRQQPKRTT